MQWVAEAGMLLIQRKKTEPIKQSWSDKYKGEPKYCGSTEDIVNIIQQWIIVWKEEKENWNLKLRQ